MKSYLLDTNSLLRFLLNDIPEQSQQTARLLSEAKADKVRLYIPQIVIFEIAYILEKYYKFKKEAVVNGVKAVISAPYLEVQDRKLFQAAIRKYQESNLSLVDCFLVYSTKEKGFELFTFDKELVKLAEKS